MAQKSKLQQLTNIIIGINNNGTNYQNIKAPTYNVQPSSKVVYSFPNQEERDAKLKQLKQDKYMSYLWKKVGYDSSMQQMAGATQTKVMYRDADLMAQWPEIRSALLTIAEEATVMNDKGKILNIYSKSERIKAVLEDLFVNRLDINVWLKTIIFATCKYGNEFMFLNITSEDGIKGWRELPVYEIKRIENGMQGLYGSGNLGITPTMSGIKSDDVRFVWEGHNDADPYKSWMVAHFRLINDSLYLPYGVSILNSARRHWRMLSMMEDGMLLYRLERSVERRIYKVNVGLIDDEDVPAFLQEFMNTVKRTPIIDPSTGQIDLRKNFLDVTADYVIPVRNGQDNTSIDILNTANNQTSMADINYMQTKILAALRIPKSFLNFQETTHNTQNLSVSDICFARMINSIQQCILMELNKIAIIHLYLLGFEDDLNNFSLSLNNPSNQITMAALDEISKRCQVAQMALQQQGGGIPLMSWRQVQKEIMGKTDAEIADILNDIRLEFAIANELQKTSDIISATHMFDKVDRIYGTPGAKYQQQNNGEGNPMEGGGGAGMPLGDGFGGGLNDLGSPDEMEGDINSAEGSEDLNSMEMPSNENSTPLTESLNKISKHQFIDKYINIIKENKEEVPFSKIDIINKNLIINESIDKMIKNISKISQY